MLVLSREIREAIVIGDRIRVVIVDVRLGKVRVGIDAPSNIPVHREEVYDAILRGQNRDSARIDNNPGGVTRSAEPGHPLRVIAFDKVQRLTYAVRARRDEAANDGGPRDANRARVEELNGVLRMLDALLGEVEKAQT